MPRKRPESEVTTPDKVVPRSQVLREQIASLLKDLGAQRAKQAEAETICSGIKNALSPLQEELADLSKISPRDLRLSHEKISREKNANRALYRHIFRESLRGFTPVVSQKGAE